MIKSVFQICIALFVSSIAFGQVTNLGDPIGWSAKVSSQGSEKLFFMPNVDLAVLQAEDFINDQAKDAPWRFGFKHAVGIKLAQNEDAWSTLENGDRIWSTRIICNDALSINLLLEDLFIPEGAFINLYDSERTNKIGAYTSRNNRKDGLLSTELIIGDNIVVEYYEPQAVQGQGRFTIGEVVHGYRSIDVIQDQLAKALNSSADCHYDVNCPLGNGWEDQIRSVAMIIVNGNGICSGALVNNTCQDGRPLILSANHCFTSGTTTWSFRFNWISPLGTESCADTSASVDPGPPYDQTANGATVLENGTEADHLLLEVDNMTLADAMAWNLYYAGWNHNDNTNITQATCIHHPLGDVMKISQEDDAPFHSFAAGAEVWWVASWEQGTTQGGSSGGPLFDQNGRIVGQLFGGQAGCVGTNNNGSFDYFGRLGVAWDLGLSDHLAPVSCGQSLVLDGWDPNVVPQYDDASAEAISSPTSIICDITFTPEISIRNAGDNALTSCTVTYNIDGGTDIDYFWTGTLPPNNSENITLPALTSTSGAHTFNVSTSLPNLVVDSDPSNDAISTAFTLVENTVATYLNLSTDCYGYEQAWEIYNGSSTLMESGGNQTVPPGGAQTAASSDPGSYGNSITVNEKMCLAVGCYDFIIYDDWGDGLQGSTQSGCNTDGDYSITNNSNTVLGSMQNLAFGVSETITFCVVYVGIKEFELNDFLLFPNPSDGLIHISLNSSEQINFNLKVRDLSGRLILETTLIENISTINLQNVADGSYFFTVENGNSTFTKKVIVKN